MIEITQDGVIYASRTKLLELGYEVAQMRNLKKPEAQEKINQASKIRIWLKALDYSSYLTREQKERIWYDLIKIADINDYPTSPILGTVEPPAILVGIQGVRGERGERGEDGGATDFGVTDQSIDVVVDSFSSGDAFAARWDYVIYDNSSRRVGSLLCDWNGSDVSEPAELTNGGTGDTEDVQFTVDYFGGQIRLIAAIASGTWNIRGSRYFIPNNGTGTGPISTSLPNTQIFIGNSSNIAQARSVTGVISISNTGVTSYTSGSIADAAVSATANISTDKLAALTASKVAVTNSSGKLATSTLDASKLTFLSNVTSDIQAQLDTKISSVSGAISTVTSSDLTVNRIVISNASGKIAVGPAYISGSNIGVSTPTPLTPLHVTGRTTTDGISTSGASGVYTKSEELQTGTWDMTSLGSKIISLGGIDFKMVKDYKIIVRNDADTDYYDFAEGGTTVLNSSGIVCDPDTAGIFSSSNFNSTSFNRGTVYITYKV